jgi:hypothetical protein
LIPVLGGGRAFYDPIKVKELPLLFMITPSTTLPFSKNSDVSVESAPLTQPASGIALLKKAAMSVAEAEMEYLSDGSTPADESPGRFSMSVAPAGSGTPRRPVFPEDRKTGAGAGAGVLVGTAVGATDVGESVGGIGVDTVPQAAKTISVSRKTTPNNNERRMIISPT